MITQRFRPVFWVAGVAVAATGLYLVSLRVATERGRLEEIDRQIAETRREIRQLQTELGTRASLRQLEKWNGEALALTAPKATQFLHSEAALAVVDPAKLKGATPANTAPSLPPIMVAAAQAKVPDALATQAPANPAPIVTRSDKVALLDKALLPKHLLLKPVVEPIKPKAKSEGGAKTP